MEKYPRLLLLYFPARKKLMYFCTLTNFKRTDYLPKSSTYFQPNNHTVLQGLRVEKSHLNSSIGTMCLQEN